LETLPVFEKISQLALDLPDEQELFDTLIPCFYGLAENGPFSDMLTNSLINNLATKINWLTQSHEITYDVQELLVAFFKNAIYSDEEKESMLKNIDSFFINEIFNFADLEETVEEESMLKHQILDDLCSTDFESAIAEFIKENYQNEEADKGTLLYLAKKCKGECFSDIFEVDTDSEDHFIIGNYIILTAHDEKTYEQVVGLLDSDDIVFRMYAGLAVQINIEGYSDYVAKAFISLAPLLSSFNIYKYEFISFLTDFIVPHLLPTFVAYIGELCEALKIIIHESLSSLQYIFKTSEMLKLFAECDELAPAIFETFVPMICELLANKVYYSSGASLLSYILKGRTELPYPEFNNHIVPPFLHCLELFGDYEEEEDNTLQSLMFCFNFFLRNEVYDVIPHIIHLFETRQYYVFNCSGVVALVLLQEEAYAGMFQQYFRIFQTTEVFYDRDRFISTLASVFAINPEILEPILSTVEYPLQDFIQFVVDNLRLGLSSFQICLTIFMLFNLDLNVTYKEETMSTKNVAIKFLLDAINSNKRYNCLDNKVCDFQSFVENDAIFDRIEFSNMTLREFTEYLLHDPPTDDPVFSEALQEIASLLA
jgi:hypothetical protein